MKYVTLLYIIRKKLICNYLCNFFYMLLSGERIDACLPLGQVEDHSQSGCPLHIPERNAKHIKILQKAFFSPLGKVL